MKDNEEETDCDVLARANLRNDILAGKKLVADTLLSLSTRDEIRTFFSEHLLSATFGQDTMRNTPANTAAIQQLEDCMRQEGVSHLNFSIAVGVKSAMANLLRGMGDGNVQFEELCVQAPNWRATLIDGHHRCDALLHLLDKTEFILSNFQVRVMWVEDDGDSASLREYVTCVICSYEPVAEY